MSWCTRSGVRAERGARDVGRGQHVEEVATARPQHVEVAAPRRLDHLRRVETPASSAPRTPTARPSVRRVRGVDRESAGKRRRVAAHLGAALHAGVTADRHQPGAGAADVAPREREVDDRLHVVDAVTCCVMPIDHTSTAVFASAYICANRSMSAARRAGRGFEPVERLAPRAGRAGRRTRWCARARTPCRCRRSRAAP